MYPLQVHWNQQDQYHFFIQQRMTIKEKLYADMIVAMKAQDRLKTDSLKMIKAEILKHETSGSNIQTSDNDVIQILNRAIKQRKEAAEGFQKGGNTEMAEKELKEVEIYKTYLPEQMPEEEIKTVILQTKAEIGATGPSDMGKLMSAVMAKLKGKADGSLINKLVKNLLN